MTNDPNQRFTPSEKAAPVTVVRLRERVADTVAAICLVSGTGLFLFARQSLASLADGTYLVPVGASYVSRADLHLAQSRIGLWLAAAGLALAIGAAMSHSRARRAGVRRRLASADAH
jgi:hypothetical protein